jgi:hypothetical protein
MTINVEKTLVEKIEALQYEVESRKDIISQILANGFKVAGDAFAKYQAEYKEYFIQYNKAKREMLDFYGVKSSSSWNLDFASCVLTVEE